MRAFGLFVAMIGITLCAIVQMPAAKSESARLPPDPTVKAVLPGCQSLADTKGVPATREAAFCSGMIDILLYLGEMLPSDFCYAVPIDVPRQQVVQAIVREIEGVYMTVANHHFRALALEVLQFNWPCHYAVN
jgi:hypothetical protein